MIKKHALAAALAVLAAAGAAQAEDFKPKGKGDVVLNVRITDVAPTGSDPVTTLAGASTGLTVKADYDIMPTIGLTYFLSDHLAVEAIAGTTQHTIKAKGAAGEVKVKETWVLPPVVTLQYHFAPAARVSPYVGAGLNYMLFYGGDDKNGFQVKLDDGFGTALQAGVDIATGGGWAVNLDAKKVFFETDAVDSALGVKSKVTLNPWVLSAGIGRRF